jgi:hypothetical protein
MAFVAVRSVGSSSSQGSSVDTSIKLLFSDIMAYSTVHPLQNFRVGEFFHIGILVAVDAIRIFVDG